jgi:hypothetical protein
VLRNRSHFRNELIGVLAGLFHGRDLIGNDIATVPELFDFKENFSSLLIAGSQLREVDRVTTVSKGLLNERQIVSNVLEI